MNEAYNWQFKLLHCTLNEIKPRRPKICFTRHKTRGCDSWRRGILWRLFYDKISITLGIPRIFSGTRVLQAQLELIERQTANYPRPEWRVFDRQGQLMDEVVRFDKPYCELVEFVSPGTKAADEMPNILLVAPLSGHWATLLRDTVQTFAQDHRVFVTDWKNTRDVAVSEGEFHLDDYVDYLLDFIRTIDGPVHAVAVCQPSVPVLMTAAVQAMRGEQKQLSSITLMGGPIDTRLSPTKVNQYAAKKRLDWFEKNVVTTVPLGYEGVGQRVYPGFLQLSGFMAMNLNNHLSSHFQFFRDLISGDGDSAENIAPFTTNIWP